MFLGNSGFITSQLSELFIVDDTILLKCSPHIHQHASGICCSTMVTMMLNRNNKTNTLRNIYRIDNNYNRHPNQTRINLHNTKLQKKWVVIDLATGHTLPSLCRMCCFHPILSQGAPNNLSPIYCQMFVWFSCVFIYTVTSNYYYYYMVTMVCALWLAAERALFSCNDRALWNFFSSTALLSCE